MTVPNPYLGLVKTPILVWPLPSSQLYPSSIPDTTSISSPGLPISSSSHKPSLSLVSLTCPLAQMKLQIQSGHFQTHSCTTALSQMLCPSLALDFPVPSSQPDPGLTPPSMTCTLYQSILWTQSSHYQPWISTLAQSWSIPHPQPRSTPALLLLGSALP